MTTKQLAKNLKQPAENGIETMILWWTMTNRTELARTNDLIKANLSMPDGTNKSMALLALIGMSVVVKEAAQRGLEMPK